MSICKNPPINWVKLLKKGDTIYLVKEDDVATVVSHSWLNQDYIKNIGILYMYHIEKLQEWYITIDGLGLDFQPLILPCLGYDYISTPIEETVEELDRWDIMFD